MNIFPKEIIENTTQTYIPKNSANSKIIYGVILTALVISIMALPFINVKIYSSARGIIKSDKERVKILSINSGKVLFSNIKNNKYVERGDILLIVENNVLDDQIALTEYESQKLRIQIEDLTYLVSNKYLKQSEIRSPKYQKEYIQYREKLSEYNTRIKKLKIDHDRNHKLFLKGVIARVKYENIKLDYDLALNSKNQYNKQQLNTWQATLTQLEGSLRQVENRNSQYIKSKKDYIITAPISGTLINSSGIQKGSIISSGMPVMEISPDSDLLAECYISPKDIGLINDAKPINFQIDAYNYNQWGHANGRIIEISKDIEIINDQPIFKVRCLIKEKYLELKSGAKGKISKGMTLNARFELAERSLYQLLYDNVDNWINPGTKKDINKTD